MHPSHHTTPSHSPQPHHTLTCIPLTTPHPHTPLHHTPAITPTLCPHQAQLRSPPRGLAKCHEAVHGYLSAVRARLKELNVRQAPSLAHLTRASSLQLSWQSSTTVMCMCCCTCQQLCALIPPCPTHLTHSSLTSLSPHTTTTHPSLSPHTLTYTNRSLLISLIHSQQQQEDIRYHGNRDLWRQLPGMDAECFLTVPPIPHPLQWQAAHGDVLAALLQYRDTKRVPQSVMQARSVPRTVYTSLYAHTAPDTPTPDTPTPDTHPHQTHTHRTHPTLYTH